MNKALASSNVSHSLKMVIELCRHGARAPISMQYYVTGSTWPNGLGMLTEIGER
jgi:hypothetical protein